MRRRPTSRLLSLVAATAVAVPLLGVSPAGAAGPGPAPVPAPLVQGGPVAPRVQALGLPEAGTDAGGRATTRGRFVDVPPFELVGLTWEQPATGAASGEVSVQVRVREGATWSAWEVLGVEDAGADPGTAESSRARAGTEPLMTRRANGVEVLVSSDQVLRDLRVDLVDPGAGAADAVIGAAGPSATGTSTTSAVATAPVAGARPAMVTRAGWGADESLRDPDASYSQTLKAIAVHHTATTNSYTSSAQAAREVRAVYAFHTRSRGWDDIGYNFLVDRFGTVFEGRAGSVDRLVIGAHSGGFNTDTMGVAALGTYTSTRPSAAQEAAIARVIGWKLGQYGVNPTGRTTLTSAGGGTARYPAGTTITVPVVTGHRTFGLTDCPGDAMVGRLGAIAAAAQRIVDAAPPTVGSFPVVGDWDADGRDDVGWFGAGAWMVRRGNGTVSRFAFGSPGDLPVVGDWNGDGRDDVGVYRRGAFHLRAALSTGPVTSVVLLGRSGDLPVVGRFPGGAGLSLGVVRGRNWYLATDLGASQVRPGFALGRTGDVPLIGDWDGDGRTTPGVVREPQDFYLANALGSSTDVALRFGGRDDVAVAGDWDGDGRTTPAVVRGSSWFWRDDLAGGPGTATITF